MFTDLEPKLAHRRLVEVEEVYEPVARWFAERAPARERPRGLVRIIVFARDVEYQQFGPRRSLGFFTKGLHDIDPAPTMVVTGALGDQTRTLLLHELSHHFSHYYLPRAPVWVDEGLAEYLSALAVEPTKVTFGAPLPDWPHVRIAREWDPITQLYGGGVAVHEFPSIGALRAADRQVSGTAKTLLQAASWTLVHMLEEPTHGYRERFHSYLGRLAAGDDADAAGDELFAASEIEDLEADYRSYFKDAIVRPWHVDYEPPDSVPVVERAMDEAEVHLLWADLHAWKSPGGFQRAQADLAEAAQRARGSPEVAYWRARFASVTDTGPPPAQLLRRVVAARPEEPRYWAALAEVLLAEQRRAAQPPTRELEQVTAKLATLARTAVAWRLVAEYRLQAAAFDAGVDAAHHALAADSSCWSCADVLGALLYRAGRLQEAIDAERLAVELVPEAFVETRAAVQARLEEYRYDFLRRR